MTDTTPSQPKSIPSLNEAARQNVNTGVLLLCKEACVQAMLDRELKRGHLAVLAAIATFINGQTAKAWPSRQAIAIMTGMDVTAVSNRLYELKKKGYLIGEEQRVAEANNRVLMVYTFGGKAIDHETIRREISRYVGEMRARGRNAPEDDITTRGDETSPPVVTSEPTSPPVVISASPPVVNITTPGGAKSPPVVDSNSYSGREESKGAKAPQSAPATIEQMVWQQGIAWLVSVYGDGMTQKEIRSRMGLLFKNYGGGKLLDALAKAQKLSPIDPLDYVTKMLSGSSKTKSEQNAMRRY